MKIRAIDLNFPNRGGVGLRSSEREPKASAVGGKTNRVCRPGNRYQFSDVRTIRVSQENVRPLGNRELPTVWGPHRPMGNNIRKMAGGSSRQRQYPSLCLVLYTNIISQ